MGKEKNEKYIEIPMTERLIFPYREVDNNNKYSKYQKYYGGKKRKSSRIRVW